jgi:hypothetical protein
MVHSLQPIVPNYILDAYTSYTDTHQVTTNLTDRQTVSHNHYAKIIRNPAMIAIVTRITTVMMMITTVSLTKIRFIAIATNQATNDNYRH